MQRASRILAILIILSLCLAGWFLLPETIREYVSNPLIFLFIVAFSLLPLLWVFENWRKFLNPLIELVYNTLTYRRRREYFSPKISIEGHGIKRGLTLVEAAVLAQKPFVRVLCVILESCIQKQAIHLVVDSLKLDVEKLFPDDLVAYERDFARACRESIPDKRKEKLVECLVKLVKTVNTKMRGFDLMETLAFYQVQVDHETAKDFDWRVIAIIQEMIGNIEKFTLQVTGQTNPLPDAPIFKEVPEYLKIKTLGRSSSGGRYYGGGGGGCACAGCACACAGCACACAGGGR